MKDFEEAHSNGYLIGKEDGFRLGRLAGQKDVLDSLKDTDPWLYEHLINSQEMQAKLKGWGIECQ